MDKQEFLKFYKVGEEEAKTNARVARKGYGQAYLGEGEGEIRARENYATFIEQGGTLRAEVNTERMKGRRDTNIITWRNQMASRLATPSDAYHGTHLYP